MHWAAEEDGLGTGEAEWLGEGPGARGKGAARWRAGGQKWLEDACLTPVLGLTEGGRAGC